MTDRTIPTRPAGAEDTACGRVDSSAVGKFALLGLAATLTAGTVLGAVSLLKLQVYFIGATAEIKRLHALYQLLGLMGCFIAGVATHVVPKYWSVHPPSTGLVRSLWLLMAAMLGLRAVSVFSESWAVFFALASDVAAIAAGMRFSGWIVHARVTSHRPVLAVDGLLFAGALWWPVGAFLMFVGEWPIGDDVLLPWGVAAGQETLLWGFVMHWFLGMAPRVTPLFGRFMTVEARSGSWLLALATAGVALRASSYALLGPGFPAVVGQLLLALMLLAYASHARPPRGWNPRSAQGAIEGSMMLSVAWLAIGAFAYLVDAVLAIGGMGPSHALILDGARHSIAVGFALSLMMAITSKIVPNFAGRPLPFPRLMIGALFLLHASVLARLTQTLAATAAGPALLAVSGSSGLFAMAATLVWTLNLLGCRAMPAR